MGENTLVGYSSGTPFSAGDETNWACPLPNFCMFTASDKVCGTAGACNTFFTGLASTTLPPVDNGAWQYANKPATGYFDNINYGQVLTLKVVPVRDERSPHGRQLRLLRRCCPLLEQHDGRHGLLQADHTRRQQAARSLQAVAGQSRLVHELLTRPTCPRGAEPQPM